MNRSTQNKNVSFHIEGLDVNPSDRQSLSEKYLCQQNLKLNESVRDQLEKICGLEEQVRELEEEQDKQDNSTRYLRLLCANLNIVDKNTTALYGEYKIFKEHNQRLMKSFLSDYKRLLKLNTASAYVLIGLALVMLVQLLFAFNFINACMIISIGLPLSIQRMFQTKVTYFQQKYVEQERNFMASRPKRETYVTEIKEIKDSKDYLEEFISMV